VAWVPGPGLLSAPVFTRRARSSPRHARGLNVAHFLRPCRLPSAPKAAGWRQGMGRAKTCDSLHWWGFSGLWGVSRFEGLVGVDFRKE